MSGPISMIKQGFCCEDEKCYYGHQCRVSMCSGGSEEGGCRAEFAKEVHGIEVEVANKDQENSNSSHRFLVVSAGDVGRCAAGQGSLQDSIFLRVKSFMDTFASALRLRER